MKYTLDIGLDDCKSINCDFVLDIDENRNIIGIEYIDYCDFLDRISIQKFKDKFEGKVFNRISLDSDAGVLYLKIKSGKSINQINISGSLFKSLTSELVSLSLNMEN